MSNDVSTTNQTSDNGIGRPRRQIRVAYDIGGVHDRGQAVGGSHWHQDSPENRRMLQVILESGNEIFGEGAYWIEERQA